MSMYMFHQRFPDVMAKEGRSAHFRGDDCVPDGDYLFLEAYCTDPKCDCRRVLLTVVNSATGEVAATVGFGFSPDDPMGGPYLDLINPQSSYADAMFELVSASLQDPGYVARLERHYRMMKEEEAPKPQPWWKNKKKKKKWNR